MRRDIRVGALARRRRRGGIQPGDIFSGGLLSHRRPDAYSRETVVGGAGNYACQCFDMIGLAERPVDVIRRQLAWMTNGKSGGGDVFLAELPPSWNGTWELALESAVGGV